MLLKARWSCHSWLWVCGTCLQPECGAEESSVTTEKTFGLKSPTSSATCDNTHTHTVAVYTPDMLSAGGASVCIYRAECSLCVT